MSAFSERKNKNKDPVEWTKETWAQNQAKRRKERLQITGRVMVAAFITKEEKADLDFLSEKTRRTRSGIIGLALAQWMAEEKRRLKSKGKPLVEVLNNEPLESSQNDLEESAAVMTLAVQEDGS